MEKIEPLILTLVLLASRAYDVQAPLILAIIDAESSFNLHAVGDHDEEGVPHSFGLMQISDRTVGKGYSPELLLNPGLNILLGVSHLKWCLEMHPNFIKLAIAAYPAGPEGAAKRGYEDQRTYVENVLNLRRKYEKELSQMDPRRVLWDPKEEKNG